MRLIDADVLAEIFIDRMEKVTERFGFNSSEAGILAGAYKLLQSQPTIEPDFKWIPCKERLPEEMTRVLTTIKMPRTEPKVRSGIYSDGFFMNDNGDVWRTADKEVKAWQPLPEPYRGEQK